MRNNYIAGSRILRLSECYWTHGSNVLFYKVFGDSSTLNPLEMDWSFPLPSYSYSKKSNYTGVNSNVYGIRVAKKSVLYSPSPFTVSGGSSLRFRDFAVITSLLLPIRGTGGYCSLLLPHWSLLPGYSPPLSVISCVIVTIKCFVFFFRSRSAVFHYFSCCSVFFCFWAQNGRLSISQKSDVTIRSFEKENFQNILTLFLTNKWSLRPLILFPFCAGRFTRRGIRDGGEIYCGLVFFCGSSPQTVLLESVYPPDAWLDKDYVEEVGPGLALTDLLHDPALLSNNGPAWTTLHVDCEPPYRTPDQVYSGRKV